MARKRKTAAKSGTKPRKRVAKRAPAPEPRSDYWAMGAGLLGVALIIGAAVFVYMDDNARNTVVGMVDNINLESVNLPNSIPFFGGGDTTGRS